MAEGLSVGFDPLFTMDVVRDFMLANGGKVSNHALVTHFKLFLNDSQRKNANRQMFKQYVNTLAVVKLDVSGEKLLVLKKKYRDSGSFRGDPAAAKFLPTDPGQVKAKRAKTEDMQSNQTTDVQLTSDVDALSTDDKENMRKISSESVPDLSVADMNAVSDKTEEELEMSADDQLLESDVNNTESLTHGDLDESSAVADIEPADVTNNDISATTVMSASDNMDYGLCTLLRFIIIITFWLYILLFCDNNLAHY